MYKKFLSKNTLERYRKDTIDEIHNRVELRFLGSAVERSELLPEVVEHVVIGG